MKLQDPLSVRVNVNNQKRLDIDNGLKLARKVDNLRETVLEEENRYNLFKEETIKIIQQDINNKIFEKESLQVEIKKLEEQRKSLMIPLDKEWGNVNSSKQSLQTEKDILTSDQKVLNEKIRQVEEDNKNFLSKQKLLDKKIKENQDKLDITNKNLKLSEETLEKSKTESETRLKGCAEKEKQLLDQENILNVYAQTLEIKENKIKEEEQEIINEKIRLADQRGILERAMSRLNI